MKTTNIYQIKEAHSGTSKKEVEKAKRKFREAQKKGKVWGQNTGFVHITFEDVNYILWAHYRNEFGEVLTDPIRIK